VAISQKRPATPGPVLLDIALFGEFRLSLDGRPGRLSAPPKAKLVLANLLLHHGTVERERIAFALWPDARETEGRANLRRHLYHLQRALPTRCSGTPWLSTSENSVSWIDGTDVRVDTFEFERLANDVQKRSTALDLYRGDLLENSDEEWLAPHRARLRARYLAKSFWSKHGETAASSRLEPTRRSFWLPTLGVKTRCANSWRSATKAATAAARCTITNDSPRVWTKNSAFRRCRKRVRCAIAF
jgi:hypothetical protein